MRGVGSRCARASTSASGSSPAASSVELMQRASGPASYGWKRCSAPGAALELAEGRQVRGDDGSSGGEPGGQRSRGRHRPEGAEGDIGGHQDLLELALGQVAQEADAFGDTDLARRVLERPADVVAAFDGGADEERRDIVGQLGQGVDDEAVATSLGDVAEQGDDAMVGDPERLACCGTVGQLRADLDEVGHHLDLGRRHQAAETATLLLGMDHQAGRGAAQAAQAQGRR